MRHWFLLTTAALLACSAPRPSPEYERASALWTELVRVSPDTAAEDPRADEVLERLARVPADSADASAAAALRARIETERRDRAAERARREELLRRAAAPTPPVASAAGPSQGARDVQPGVPAAPSAVAVIGLTAEAFRATYGSCFHAAGEVAVTRPDAATRPGELWAMNDEPRCREAHPALVGQVVAVSDGSVVGVRPAAAVRRFEVRQEAELAKLPDGRPGMVVDGRIVPIPAGAKVVPAGAGGAAR